MDEYLPLTAGEENKLTGPLGLTQDIMYGTILPENGFEGQLFFLEDESSGEYLPSGGVAGQALIKNSNAEGDASWQDIVALPKGGDIGQALIKVSAEDGDADWTTQTIALTGDVTGSGSFDGSGNLNITTVVGDNSHNHTNYLPLAGGTMTGALNFQNDILNQVGDDSAFGDQNLAGHFIIQGLNGTTSLGFKEYGATSIASIHSDGTRIWTGVNALLPCWSTLTGGNANTTGWRLIGSHALGAWHNNRANFIINSRHTGNGLLSIAYGCNADEINQKNVYCDVVISGNSSGAGAIWNDNAFKCYYNSANNYLYFFWYYTDYNSTDIISFGSPISDFYPRDGTWVETIDTATYGVEITTLRRSWNQGDAVTGAVWNDYAECRESDCNEPGYVLSENGDDTLSKSTERLAPFAGVSSDTWGFSQGETEKAKTHIAVAGRVLAYPYQDRNNYKPGDCVCAAPGGTVDIMTREEIREWPDRIVGTVSCVPEYEEWGGGKDADRLPVKVNGRIWIKVK